MEQKRGEGTQRFLKVGGKLGQGVGALKKWGLEPSLQTMAYKCHIFWNFVELSASKSPAHQFLWYVMICAASKSPTSANYN